MSKISNLLFTMMKIGAIGFGGGNALVPVIEKNVVEEEGLVTAEEFEEDILIANITPGALPLEIAGGIGKRVWGKKGMLLCSMAMAIPGACLTLLLLSAMSRLNEAVLLQIEYITVGITAFISCLLTTYVVGTEKMAKERKNIPAVTGVIVAVFLLTCGKNLYRVFGMEGTPFFGLATIDIFILAFFVIFYTRCTFTKVKAAVSVLLCVFYILDVAKCHLIPSGIVGWGIRIAMIALALYGFRQDISKGKNVGKMPWKNIVKGVVLLVIAVLVSWIPAVMITRDSFLYVSNTILSSIMSFGGGDAYLTVADGLFVTPGLVSEDEFYSYIVPVVNILPGSILCKTVTGIGYYIGYGISQNVFAGLIVAFAGFMASVAASCGVFHVMGDVYKCFGNLDIFQGIKIWIRPIVAGLMFTVILSLVYQNCKLGVAVGERFTPVIYMLVIYAMNLFLYYKAKMKSGVLVMLSAILSFGLCNCFLG